MKTLVKPLTVLAVITAIIATPVLIFRYKAKKYNEKPFDYDNF